MSVKCFDLERLVKLPLQPNSKHNHYVAFDSIVGVSLNITNNVVIGIRVSSDYISIDSWSLAAFEAEVDRAVKKTMADQNQELIDFRDSVREAAEKRNAELHELPTDKIADYN